MQGKLGLRAAFSHLDIYPNGGVVFQPGCLKPRKIIFLSHARQEAAPSRSFYPVLELLEELHNIYGGQWGRRQHCEQ